MLLKDLLKKGNDADRGSMDEEDYQKYLHDYNTDITHAWAKGFARGILSTLTKRFKSVPQEIDGKIRRLVTRASLEKLASIEKLAGYAWNCESVEEFVKQLDTEAR